LTGAGLLVRYYPAIFYPELARVKGRYLKLFEPVYYLKPLPNGLIFRKVG
jgi:hypothetical protein